MENNINKGHSIIRYETVIVNAPCRKTENPTGSPLEWLLRGSRRPERAALPHSAPSTIDDCENSTSLAALAPSTTSLLQCYSLSLEKIRSIIESKMKFFRDVSVLL